ncbi:MAG: putative polybetaDmannuronate Oacetylase [Bradyrhizobium sp.]|nr:putative polybetaDmannuronate Oacetylase [Bradyrhizobium sp.]
MLFNTYPFLLVFLPIAILLYRLADPYPRFRIGMLVLLSFVFYSYWNPPFIALLALSIVINWLAARAYASTKRPIIITAAIVLDLAVLGVFKYANFFAYNLGVVLDRPMPQFDIVLPLGISFFTFHHIMYLVDLRRGKAPFYSLDRHALYISFFPQAIAGPLARWSEVMQQFGREVYAPGWQRRFALGATFIVIGLVEKTLLADRIGHLIDPIYAQAQLGLVSDGRSWLALSFGFQILFDFAGYSDIAIGLGLLFGVQLPFNFNAPYRSTNIQDFWQRWHITLMLFLRDYVFHPLINARVVHRRFFFVQYFAAMLLTMALCGLWHGANWTFVLWGIMHGCALVLCSLWRRFCPRLGFLLGWVLTVAFVLLTGVIFRAGTLDAAWHIFRGLAVLPNLTRVGHLAPIFIGTLVAFLLPASQDIVARLIERPKPVVSIALGIIVVALLVELGDRDVYEFVYFQF